MLGPPFRRLWYVVTLPRWWPRLARKIDAESDALGVTLTTRRPRRVPNSTCPATRANKVSSPPRPTPSPGWKWVPRCRTMISPAFTSWPPNRLTPSRCELESRPFRVEDAPFLCAMSSPQLLISVTKTLVYR